MRHWRNETLLDNIDSWMKLGTQDIKIWEAVKAVQEGNL
jgi:hypothetical protein